MSLHPPGNETDASEAPAAGPRSFSSRADRDAAGPTVFGVLDVLADLMKGGRHTRGTIARGWRISLPTADRWIKEILGRVPGVVRARDGKRTCIAWSERGGRP